MKTSNRETFPPSSWSATIVRRSDIRGLCLILDADLLTLSAGKTLAVALAAGVRLFQYRNKSGSRNEVYSVSNELAGMVKRAGGIFIVNDHADIAKAVDADGVHLGQGDLPLAYGRKVMGKDKLIGISTHSVEQAREAEAAGADYIGFGPLFPTMTKDAGPCQGTEKLRSLRNAVALPVLAIGGITLDTLAEAMAAGADGVAVISAVLSAPDPAAVARAMIDRIERLGSTKNR
ncbi:MAG: thiamine phosphate synthase [Nitrospirota bacterium]